MTIVFDNAAFKLDTESAFYKNCKRQRKVEAKICQDCPFREWIEEQEKYLETSKYNHTSNTVAASSLLVEEGQDTTV